MLFDHLSTGTYTDLHTHMQTLSPPFLFRYGNCPPWWVVLEACVQQAFLDPSDIPVTHRDRLSSILNFLLHLFYFSSFCYIKSVCPPSTTMSAPVM